MGVYDLNYASTDPNAMATQNYFQTSNAVQTPTSVAPGVSGQTTASTPLGMNLGTGQLALGAIGTIGNLWAAFQAQKLAKEQFQFQKGVTNTNLANQIQSYNTSLVDRITARGAMQGDSAQTTQQYIQDNSLKDQRQ